MFAVDVRSPTAAYAAQLWRIVYAVSSGIVRGNNSVKISVEPGRRDPTDRQIHASSVPGRRNFVPKSPATATAGRSAHGQLRSPLFGRGLENPPQGIPSAVVRDRTSSKASVVDVIRNLAEVLRRRHRQARERLRHQGGRGKDGRMPSRRGSRQRVIGVYVTDGRSANMTGTVYGLGRVARRLPRRVDLFAVGVGPEISAAQLASVVRGRLDRVLTAFSGHSSTLQSFNSVRQLSIRLSKLICRRR